MTEMKRGENRVDDTERLEKRRHDGESRGEKTKQTERRGKKTIKKGEGNKEGRRQCKNNTSEMIKRDKMSR